MNSTRTGADSVWQEQERSSDSVLAPPRARHGALKSRAMPALDRFEFIGELFGAAVDLPAVRRIVVVCISATGRDYPGSRK